MVPDGFLNTNISKKEFAFNVMGQNIKISFNNFRKFTREFSSAPLANGGVG